MAGFHDTFFYFLCKGEDPEEVWRRHASDKETLQSYAESMKMLATEHWERDKDRG